MLHDESMVVLRRCALRWGTGCLVFAAACTGQIGAAPDDGRSGAGTTVAGTGGGTTMTGGATTTTGGGTGTAGTTGTAGGPPPEGTDPGRVTVHRLNRVEYSNTVRDLLGTSATPADVFPVDDRGSGFDNMADVLSISPVLLALYQSTAASLVDEALTNAAERARLVTCDLVAQGATCAKAVLAGFAPRAWRRPVTDAELTHLMGLVTVATGYGDTVEQGLKLALRSVLLSPHFIFRVELDPVPDAKTPHPLGHYELASRLSYFLWSTMPDDQLFAHAKDGTLAQPTGLSTEVQRMMQSSKVGALVDNFAGQWLYTRMMDDVTPDTGAFPKFDEKLRAAEKQEAQLFFKDIVSGALSADKLLTADYTYVNDRLAVHYGLPSPGSANMTKLGLAGNTQRGGFLSQGSFLTVTSHTTRTSPVLRGKWVLNQLLCADIPPPPDNVDVMNIDKQTVGTVRQKLEAHRADPKCAVCHDMMDAVGFGLENYDAVGSFRTTEGADAIDSSGKLPGGQAFTGALELEKLIAADPAYAECVVKNLYTYALGRQPEVGTADHQDPFTIYRLTQSFRQSGYDFRDLIARIAESPTFTSRRGDVL